MKFLISIMCFLSLVGNENGVVLNKNGSSSIIVYLSRTGNTGEVAKIIRKYTGGKLEEIELENDYPDDYNAIVQQVAEENNTGFLPPLKTKVNMEKIDTLYLGFPTWGMQLPPPVKSFLDGLDLKGKIVIPFNTHAGYGVGSGFDDVERYSPGATILKGISIKGGEERKGILLDIKGARYKEVETRVIAWLETLKIKKH